MCIHIRQLRNREHTRPQGRARPITSGIVRPRLCHCFPGWEFQHRHRFGRLGNGGLWRRDTMGERIPLKSDLHRNPGKSSADSLGVHSKRQSASSQGGQRLRKQVNRENEIRSKRKVFPSACCKVSKLFPRHYQKQNMRGAQAGFQAGE